MHLFFLSSAIQHAFLFQKYLPLFYINLKHHQITFFICSSGCYKSDTAANVNDVRVKSPAEPNTDHDNGDLKFRFSPSVILLVNIRCLQ